MSVAEHKELILKQDITAAVRKGTGLNNELSMAIAEAVLKQLQHSWGGREIYFPVQSPADRDALIRQDFNGRNHAAVCTQYDISLSTLYRVTKK